MEGIAQEVIELSESSGIPQAPFKKQKKLSLGKKIEQLRKESKAFFNKSDYSQTNRQEPELFEKTHTPLLEALGHALEFLPESRRAEELGKVYYDLGNMHDYWDKYDMALHYFRECHGVGWKSIESLVYFAEVVKRKVDAAGNVIKDRPLISEAIAAAVYAHGPIS